MRKPVLVVMAAGMGSRYGGLKQLDPVDDSGHLIIDYSIFDAHRAGFDTVIFVIKPEIEEAFRSGIGGVFGIGGVVGGIAGWWAGEKLATAAVGK